MKRCDICQGRGTVMTMTMETNSNLQKLVAKEPQPNVMVYKKEQCPKCDGKGMVA